VTSAGSVTSAPASAARSPGPARSPGRDLDRLGDLGRSRSRHGGRDRVGRRADGRSAPGGRWVPPAPGPALRGRWAPRRPGRSPPTTLGTAAAPAVVAIVGAVVPDPRSVTDAARRRPPRALRPPCRPSAPPVGGHHHAPPGSARTGGERLEQPTPTRLRSSAQTSEVTSDLWRVRSREHSVIGQHESRSDSSTMSMKSITMMPRRRGAAAAADLLGAPVVG